MKKKICKNTRDYFIRNRYKFGFYKDLSECCAIASYKLFDAFQHKNINCEIVVADSNMFGHCWIESDEIVYDITASQFGLPAILIKPEKEYLKILAESNGIGKYASVTKFKCKNEFKKFLLKHH